MMRAPRTARVPVAGGHLAVTDVGTGPPLLLLHGSNSDRSWCPRLLESLAATHRCLAPDRRGAGQTTAPTGGSDPSWATLVEDVLAVVRWSGARRPLVAGASWGAKIALAYAAAGHPCAGVFGIDGAAWGADGTLHEDIYDRIACPIRLAFASESAREEPAWPYTPEAVAAFSARHPRLWISWVPCGHDIAVQRPDELARLIRDFSQVVRPQ
jgi:pimeloyl-ACP methyl ester carboxylesterase